MIPQVPTLSAGGASELLQWAIKTNLLPTLTHRCTTTFQVNTDAVVMNEIQTHFEVVLTSE